MSKSSSRRAYVTGWIGLLIGSVLTGCRNEPPTAVDSPAGAVQAAAAERLEPRKLAEGRDIFRFDDFGDWRFWTDTLRLNDAVETLSPKQALALGLKVDAAAVPPDVLAAVLANPALLNEPATTRALLGFNAVVGVTASVEGDQIRRLGITCALCHSTVNDAVVPGIGERLDGPPNRDLAIGTIISVAPGLPAELKPIYASWPTGFYDARFNVDGISAPVLIPPAYGLRGVDLETYTGEGPISYWNNYVAVTQMHGRGTFIDPRLGIEIRVRPQDDLVKPKLPALRRYQLSLAAPAPPPGSFDRAAAERGARLFRNEAGCARCHTGRRFTDDEVLHDPEETGMDPLHAERSTTKQYRTTPLRALWQHAPYFHDGSAPTLAAVVEHYDSFLGLGLSEGQKGDLVEYLKSL